MGVGAAVVVDRVVESVLAQMEVDRVVEMVVGQGDDGGG